MAAVTGFAAVPAFAAPGDQAPDTASGQNSTTSSSDSEEGEVSVSLAQDSIAAEQIADSKQGLKFTGTGFTPGDKATVTVIGTDGISYTPDTKLSVSQAGEVKGSYFFSTDKGSKVPEGSYRLFLTDLKTNEATELAKFNVGDKAEDTAEKPAEDEQQAKPEGSAKPEGASESADSASTPAEDKSADASASPSAQPSETSTPSETPSTSASPEPSDSPSATETAKPEDKAEDKKDEAGDKSEDKADEKQDDADNKSDEADKPKVTEDQLPTSTLSFSKNRVEDTDFTLSKDEVAQVEVGKKASKQQKEAAQKKSEEFAKEGKGVTLTLKNGLPGASYIFKVQQPGTAEPFELPAKTDSAGTASVWIYDKGTAATGTYKVTVEGAKAVVSDKADDADKETAKPSEAPTAGAGSITPSSTPSSETTVSATATPSPTTEADKKDDADKDSSDKKTESTAAESNEKLDWNEVRKLDKDKASNVKIEENVQVASASFTVFKAAPEPKPEPEQKTPEPKPEQKTPEQQKPTTPSTTGKDPKPASESEASGMNEKPKAPGAEKPGAEGDANQTEDGQAESDANATTDEGDKAEDTTDDGDKAEDADQADDAGDKADDAGDKAEDSSSEADQSDQTDQSEQTMTSEQEQEDTSGAEQRRELPNTTPDDHYAQPQESTGSTGSQLPRTGGDLTGLALGAGLVVVGAASIVVTRRKVSGI
ncbi:hypothetical protein HMPREF3172_10030 [Brevibacterium sp. HMSC08F02]|uniref:LPXTG cell wall anchor domain-containing protein n=1 Tax=Brevibacterium sp. HMSC08F02 TaxID=1581140 RepID=UPI0008A51F22|nr:LPXTG cell wall anchor domain-containing protein [Brevibacterium sp. HMSC08F02]OFT24776.1 hypothetical protein HMPREF3172_10030 [Brevibacterium sp. HMSC08F02]